MVTYRVSIHESFENDSTKEIILDNQNIEQILSLFEKLDGNHCLYFKYSFPKNLILTCMWLADPIYSHSV